MVWLPLRIGMGSGEGIGRKGASRNRREYERLVVWPQMFTHANKQTKSNSKCKRLMFMECFVYRIPCLPFRKITSFLKYLHGVFLTSFTLWTSEETESVRGSHPAGEMYTQTCVGTSMPTQTWMTPVLITEICMKEHWEHSRRKEQENGRSCHVLYDKF